MKSPDEERPLLEAAPGPPAALAITELAAASTTTMAPAGAETDEAAGSLNETRKQSRRRYVQVSDVGGDSGLAPLEWTGPSDTQASLPTTALDDNDGEADLVGDLRHYVAQVYAIIKPVMLCIVIVVLWVEIDQSARPPTTLVATPNSVFGFGVPLYSDPSMATAGQVFSQAVVNALIIVAVLIVVTIVFVVLFYYGFHKFLYGYLMLSTAAAYTVTAGLLILDQTIAVNMCLDWITLSFCLWNFAVVGLCSIFWMGPLMVQQFYLIAISALVAWALTKIDPWTTWVLLALLVLWDLFAVLTPCGPLKLLVESSQRQNVEIPALLYSVTMIYFMADIDDRKSIPSRKQRIQSNEAASEDTKLSTVRTPLLPGSTKPLSDGASSINTCGPSTHVPDTGEPVVFGGDNGNDEDDRSGLKLGLGDFVFYSVLVARAALSDWTSLMACVVGVLFGLTATILMLAIYRRALPALPISLTIGIIFYFATSLVVTPYVVHLALYSIHV